MKQHHHHTHGQAPKAQPVRFEFTHPTAAKVCVAGSFNNWEPANKFLQPSGAGSWSEEISLTPGIYEYRFVVDGEWLADPLAKESVPNPFGGENSVLVVAEFQEAEDSAVRQGAAGSRGKQPKR